MEAWGSSAPWEETRPLHSSVVTVRGKGVDHCVLFYKRVLLEDKNQIIGFSAAASYIRKADVLLPQKHNKMSATVPQ